VLQRELQDHWFALDLQLTRTASFAGWGTAVTVEAPSRLLLAIVAEALPPGFTSIEHGPRAALRITEDAAGKIELWEGHTLLHRAPTKDGLESRVYDAIERLAATHSTTHAFLHAGAVRADDAVIVIAGPSGSGKSTLVRALASEGASYLGDDVVPLDADGRAHPFPGRIGHRPRPGCRNTHVDPATLALKIAGEPEQPCAIVVLRFDPGARSIETKRLNLREAFAAVLQHAVGAQTQPRVVIPILTTVARRVPVLAGRRGDVAEAVPALLRAIELIQSASSAQLAARPE
jgi:hypothetical protein